MKNTKVLKSICLFMAIVLMTAFSACSSTAKSNIQYAETGLNIFKIKYWNWLDQVNSEFSTKNPNIKINTITFEDYTAYQTKLIPELYAGKGPDVIIAQSGDVRNLIKNNVLADLTEILPGDLDLETLGGNTQNIGIEQGKRYYLGIDYTMPVFFSAKSLVEAAGLPADAFSSWESFAKLAREYTAKGKYLIGGNKNAIDKFFLFMLGQSGTEIANYTKKESKLLENADEIQKLMEAYKNDILPAICPEKEFSQYKNTSEAMKAGLYLLNFSNQENYRSLWMNNSMFTSGMNSEMTILPLPNGGGSSKKYVNRIAAINNNSNYKKDAFQYLVALLNGEKEDDTFGFPMSQTLKDLQLNKYGVNEKTGKLGIALATAKGTEVIKTSLLPKTLSQEIDRLSSQAVMNVYDYGVQDIIAYRMSEYLEGKKSVADTIKNMDSAINKLLKE